MTLGPRITKLGEIQTIDAALDPVPVDWILPAQSLHGQEKPSK